MTTAADILEIMESMKNESQRQVLCRFFKTGPGEYGEGDCFLGLKVPQTRMIVREARLDVPLDEIGLMLDSRWHEVRLAALLLLVEEMKAASPSRRNRSGDAVRRRQIASFYLANARRANNWDLVDLSCPGIVGVWLLHDRDSRGTLDRLAASDNLWERRIAVVSTLALIRAGEFDDTLRIAGRLLGDGHDLIHKAVGWMLREVGKRDAGVLRDFLEDNCSKMPRTALRYAIERFDAFERRNWLERR